MRPVELIAQGFGPFRERVVVDFSDAEFFALVGPTGSGKSSVIDAICFSLYGFVPRYGDARLVAPAITTGALEARVQFSFEVAGQRYVATRVVRRTPRGGAVTKECRLERVEGETREVLAGDPREADQRAAQILGLTPEHFTRSVVLPQGEFARFIRDKPSDRQRLLVELLGLDVYGQMASAARVRATQAKAARDAVQGQLAGLAHATEDAEATARDAVTRVEEVQSRVDEAAAGVNALDADIRRAQDEIAGQKRLIERLAAVRVPPEVTEWAQQRSAAVERLAILDVAAAAAESAARDAEERVATSADPTDVQRALTTRRDLDAVAAAVPDAEATVERAKIEVATAQRDLEATDAEIAAARLALDELQRSHAAHALAETLVAGRPCPVCQVPVTHLPHAPAPAGLQEARAALDGAQKRRPARDKAARAAFSQVAAAEERLRDLLARQEERARALTDTRDAAFLAAELDRLRTLRKAAVDARHRAIQAHDAAARARSELARIDVVERDARATYTSRRDAVSALQPPMPTPDVAVDWAVFAAWAQEQLAALRADVAGREAAVAVLRGNLEEVLDALRRTCATAGVVVAGGAGFSAFAPAVATRLATATSKLEQIRKDLATAAKLRAEIEGLESRAQVADTLGQLLSARGFEAWVLQEAFDELVAGASETLEELSQGAYALDVDGKSEFVVIDHREADATRPAKTLSGGETFQASLALALALAKHLGRFAAEGATALESIFLDEGFGTLDDESLDVVASTLETLAGGERVVGIVTHVKELAARVPVRYEVRRTGRTAVVERVST